MTIDDRISEAEALPSVTKCAKTLRYLWLGTTSGSEVRLAVEAAIVRLIPRIEVLPVKACAAALHALRWATAYGSQAQRALKAAIVRTEARTP